MTDVDGAPAPSGRPPKLLRGLSEMTVLQTIFRDGPVTRPELSERTGLSKPTVSEAVRRLIHERLIRSAGVRSGQLGRSPVSYVVDDAAGYVLGIDVGGSNVRVGAADLFGEILSVRTEPRRGDIRAQVHRMVRELNAATAATHSQLLAIGASGPSPQAPESGTAMSTAVDPLSLVREQVSAPLLVDTTINLSALAEKWRGAATGSADYVVVWIGAAVGAGIVIADELVRGAHFSAGDLSGWPAEASPRGAATGSPLVIMNADALMSHAATLRWRAGMPPSVAGLLDLVDTEPAARKTIDREAVLVARTISGICRLLDPGLIVLAGAIGGSRHLLEPVRRATAEIVGRPVRIESSALGGQGALYGAVAVALRDAHDQLFRPAARFSPAGDPV